MGRAGDDQVSRLRRRRSIQSAELPGAQRRDFRYVVEGCWRAGHDAAAGARDYRPCRLVRARPHRDDPEQRSAERVGACRIGELLSGLARHGRRQAGNGRARRSVADGAAAARRRQENRTQYFSSDTYKEEEKRSRCWRWRSRSSLPLAGLFMPRRPEQAA